MPPPPENDVARFGVHCQMPLEFAKSFVIQVVIPEARKSRRFDKLKPLLGLLAAVHTLT
jgi:hypothetical protein